MFFNTGMGDGPVALLFARPRHSSPRIDEQRSECDIELTTRNGTYEHGDKTIHNHTRPAWQRFMAAMFGDRTESAKTRSP